MMSRFRTIEISDPRFERDHLRFMTVKSHHLKGRGDIIVFVPPVDGRQQALPVTILLHGVYGSAWAWTHSAGVHLQALKMIAAGELPPMVLAMPSDGLWGDGSGYLAHHEYDFEKWIAEDVVDALTEKIAGVTMDSPFFISGLSMGGFGALRIGARYGGFFKAISAHSSITALDQMRLFVEEDLHGFRQPDKANEDVWQTFKKYKEQLPPIRFDCGEADLLIEYNRVLHQRMKEHGIPHAYEEYAGGHEWGYWEKHIGRSLKFFAEHINVVTQ